MFSITDKKGFTLFEILVAVAVGSIIVIGLFDIFKNVIDARTFALKRSNSMEIVSKTITLMDRDIRCKIGEFKVSNVFGVNKLTFETTNSLRFSGSVPVTVSYYIKNQNGKTYLIREETNDAAGEDMSIKLSDAFKKIKFEFYSKGGWVDVPSPIIKIYLYSRDGNRYVFAARGIISG